MNKTAPGFSFQTLKIGSTVKWFIGGHALSFPLMIFVAVWPVLTGLGGQMPKGSFLPISIHLYDAIGSVTAALVLLVARAATSNNRNVAKKVGFVLFVWSAAAVMGAISQPFVAGLIGPVSIVFVQLIPVLALTSFGQMVTFAMLAGSRREIQNATAKLSQVRRALLFLEQNLSKELARNRDELLNHTFGVLKPVIDSLTQQFSSGKRQLEIAKSVRHVIDAVVRPLSHDLTKRTSQTEIAAQWQNLSKASRFDFANFKLRYKMKTSSANLFNFPLVTLASFVFVLPGFFTNFGFGAFLNSLAALGCSIASGLLLRELLKKKQSSYAVNMVLNLVFSGLFGTVFNIVFRAFSQQIDESLVSYMSFNFGLVNLASGYVSLQITLRWQSLQEVAETNVKLGVLVSELKQAAWLSRQRLARIVHGRLQSQLQVAALRLQLSQEGDLDLDEIAKLVASSILDLDERPMSRMRLKDNLAELQVLWNGLCFIKINCESDLMSEIENYEVAADCVSELVREAVTNAIKHSTATEIIVDIALASKGTIEVRVSSNISQRNLPQKADMGYGASMFDEICLNWSLYEVDDQMILKATLPMAQ